MPRFPFLATLCGVVLLAVGLLVTVDHLDARHQQEHRLNGQAAQAAAAFGAHFDRARSLDLLLAQNKVFSGAQAPLDVESANSALDYLERLFPHAIGEACLIDEQGRELARVTAGVPATPGELSTDEADNAFFAPTLALTAGQVYQAAPYVSPDTGGWVISNSTWIGLPDGHRLIVHFEVALASFAAYVEVDSARDHLAVVDATSGQVLLRDGADLATPGGQAGFPVTAWSAALHARTGAPSGLIDVDGHPASFQRIDRAAGNANEWYVVAWTTSRAGLMPTWAGVGGTAAGLLLIGVALLVLRRQQRTLRAVARLDHLTGLANRKALEELLDESLAEDRRSGEWRTAVLMIDLDGFKQVNDSLGHDKGDQVLQEVARRLHANVFEHDTPARLGGDEFAVVLRRLRGSERDLTSIAHRLREALIRPFEIDGVLRFVGASIGIAATTGPGDTVAELLRNADAAMYRAKRDREGVRVYEPGTSDGVQSMGRAAALLEAIENGDVVLAYQPVFSLDGDGLVGVEALARWDLAGHGPVPPSEFVPLAEDTGLIRPLTFLTLRTALDEVTRWRAEGSMVPVSVNLSGRMAAEQTFPDELAALLSERGLAGDALVLEITETALITDRAAAVAVLSRLRTLGVRIELDDFGSGYASFGALHDLPLDGVKLDRVLVADQADGEGRLLAATIETARRLGLSIIAEGIEDGAVHELVQRLGCTAAQGYHLARPMSPEAIRSLVCAAPAPAR